MSRPKFSDGVSVYELADERACERTWRTWCVVCAAEFSVPRDRRDPVVAELSGTPKKCGPHRAPPPVFVTAPETIALLVRERGASMGLVS